MTFVFFNFLILFFGSCKTAIVQAPFTTASVDTLLSDKITIRAIQVDGDRLWYGGDRNRFGCISLDGKTLVARKVSDSAPDAELRSIGSTQKQVFYLNTGTPAVLYRVNKIDFSIAECYRDNDKDAFYDSLMFDGNVFGAAIGDPIDGCPSVLTTDDHGTTWHKIDCNSLPASAKGEASFAASNSNLMLSGSTIRFVTGGVKARLFSSSDRGKTWTVFNTPLVQGKQMTGIYSADQLNEKTIIIAGGDYDNQQANTGNKAISFDGGKSWQLLAEGSGPGYISCVRFVPGTDGKSIVTVGGTGLHYSSDGGRTWKQLLSDKDLYTIKFINNSEAVAAGRNKIVRIHFR